MSGLEGFRGERASEAADALMGLLNAALRAGVSRQQVPAVVVQLGEALHAASLAMSDTGHEPAKGDMIDDVIGQWVTPADGARAVGLSDRHVRRLCRAGLVGSRRVGARALLVDLDDLMRRAG